MARRKNSIPTTAPMTRLSVRLPDEDLAYLQAESWHAHGGQKGTLAAELIQECLAHRRGQRAAQKALPVPAFGDPHADLRHILVGLPRAFTAIEGLNSKLPSNVVVELARIEEHLRSLMTFVTNYALKRLSGAGLDSNAAVGSDEA
jgi:hypothetical protein